MTADPFGRNRPGAACLSRHQLSRIALDELDPKLANHLRAHLDTCERCRGLLAEEQAALAEAAAAPMPDRLRRAEGSKTVRPWSHLSWAVAGVATAASVVLLFLYLPRVHDHAGLRSKGSVRLAATVRRAGKILASESSLAQLPEIRDGDQLRIKVTGAAGRAIALRACDAHQCSTVYRGLAAADAWLPTGLTASQGESELQLLHCLSLSDLDPWLEQIGEALEARQVPTGCYFLNWRLEIGPATAP